MSHRFIVHALFQDHMSSSCFFDRASHSPLLRTCIWLFYPRTGLDGFSDIFCGACETSWSQSVRFPTGNHHSCIERENLLKYRVLSQCGDHAFEAVSIRNAPVRKLKKKRSSQSQIFVKRNQEVEPLMSS